MDDSQYTDSERAGASIAHGCLLLIGLPITFILLPVPFSLAPCPVVSYVIARYFRRRGLLWGANQSIQASVLQIFVLVIAALAVLTNLPSRMDLALSTVGFLLFLYSLWGAFDTLLGYDFNYYMIGNLVSRVSKGNAARPERRRK